MNVPNAYTSLEDTIDYFTQTEWGEIYEDDKYWEDEDLEDNFIIFVVYAFAYLNLPRPSKAQLEIAKFAQDRKSPHRLVWAMRSIAKSLMSQLYVIWRLLRNPNEHILVLSAKSSRAKNYTLFVKKVLALLPITKPLAPRNNKERTSGESFDVAGADASDSPSVYAAGAGNTVTGMRASLLIIDDVETPITVTSAALTSKVQDSVDEAHNLLMSDSDESLTLATPHSVSSMYLSWLEQGTVGFIVPAEYPEDQSPYMGYLASYIQDRLKKDPSLIGQAVDERLNKQFLMDKRLRIGKSKFKLQYLLDVSESDDLRFPLKLSDLIVTDVNDDEGPLKIGHSSMPDNKLYIKHNGFKSDKLYSPSFESEETTKYDMKLMSIDPSGRGTDEAGIAIMYTLNTRIFIKRITGLTTGYDDETFMNIVQLAKAHGIDTIITEDNYGDGAFGKMLEPYMIKYLPNVVSEGFKVTGQKETRIINLLEPLLNQHRIVVDKTALDKDSTSALAYSFSYQLSHITTEPRSIKHDDRLDAVANGVKFILEYLGDNEETGMDNYIDALNEKIMSSTSRVFASILGGRGRINYGAKY